MSDEVLVSRAALQRVVTLLEQLPQLDPLLLVDLDDALRSSKADSLREQIRDLEEQVRRLREGW